MLWLIRPHLTKAHARPCAQSNPVRAAHRGKPRLLSGPLHVLPAGLRAWRCMKGNGFDGQAMLSWLDPVEMGGTLLLEAVGVEPFIHMKTSKLCVFEGPK